MPLNFTLTCDDCDTALTVPGVMPNEVEAVIFANRWQHSRSIGTRCPACAAAKDEASSPESDWPEDAGLDAEHVKNAVEALDEILAQAVSNGVGGYVMSDGRIVPLSVDDLLHGGAMDMAALAAHAAKGDTP